MLDVENEVFSNLTDKLKNAVADVETSSVYTNTPSHYPFVSIEEVNNSVNINEETGCDMQAITNVIYEINVYAKEPQKKANAKALVKIVDEYMSSVGFARMSLIPIQDDNETIYRYAIRYNGNISKDNKVYRR